MAIIRMKYTLLDEIARYATGHLPEEACGLIEAKMKMVV